MVFDFGSLKAPSMGPGEIEPRALLRSLPVREGAINDLWDGQAQALASWHQERTKPDNLILLNTGAGKTVVGLLVAESLRRELGGNVIYVCPTNDLVGQVEKEARKLGLEYTIRASGAWSNDLYERGRAIAVTNYQAIFNARTVFRGDNAPKAIIFDDAHVADGVIRDQFTLRVSKKDHEALFNELRNIILRHERDASYNAKLDQVFSGVAIVSTLMASPALGRDRHEELNALFAAHRNSKDPGLSFPLAHIFGKWSLCAVCVNAASIEISPPVNPTLQYGFMQDPNIRRVYLSATLGQSVDFARAFGKDVPAPIRPDVDAGNGERLVLFSERLGGEKVEADIVSRAAGLEKVVIAAPNLHRADRWKQFAVPPRTDEFSAELEKFRAAKERGAFLLLARYDGIDLPQDTCRQMVFDGVPRGVSLLERFCWEYLDLRGELKSRIATRITQLFGRIIRGRVDHGCFYIVSRELNIWLSDDRNLALLPALLGNQIKLGLYIHDALGVDDPEKAAALVQQVLSREDGWVKFYRDWVNSQVVPDDVKEKEQARQEVIKDAALKWTQYWSALWAGDAPDKVTRLRDTLEQMMPKFAGADSRGAGWLDIWLGSRYYADGEPVHASDHFGRAKSRLLAELPLPRLQVALGDLTQQNVSSFGEQFLETFGSGIVEANRRIVRDDRVLDPLLTLNGSTNEYEEALKLLGERLGFQSTRPDNEVGVGPDALWVSHAGKRVLGFEAKTEKTADVYNKGDIGQSLNHAAWIRQNYPDYDLLGVVLIGRPERVTEESSPTGDLFWIKPDAVGKLAAAFKDLRDSVAKDIGSSRVNQVGKLGIDDEWSLSALFDRIGARNF